MIDKIKADIEDIYPHIVEVRRKIHKHPELKMEEYETARLVEEELKSLGIETYPHYADTTAVIGRIVGANPGPVRAFRADMDALPIKEETGLPYASEVDGVMHACGHDIHTASLVGLAYLLAKNKENLAGEVIFVFQPGEEGGFGGKILTDSGFIERFEISYIIGQHVYPDVPLGKIGYKVGLMTANSDRFIIKVKGKGSHGARPHYGIDPITIAAHITVSFGTIHSREVDPLDATVITVGSIHGGTASNIIPDDALMQGTIRTFGDKNREFVAKRVKEVAEGIAKTFRAKAETEVSFGYPSVFNDKEITMKVKDAAERYLGSDNVMELPVPSMGGEDFAYYLRKIPGTFYRLGVGPNMPLHNARFAPDEEVLKVGIGVFGATALLTP